MPSRPSAACSPRRTDGALITRSPVDGPVPKTTALHATHKALGATFTEFAGYDMPVHYGSIKDEHHAVRNSVGLFDVSHMSNLWVSGPGAAAAIGAVCPFDPAGLEDGRGKYTVMLREDGTILDDLFVFRVGDKFHVVPNAGMNQDAVHHLSKHAASAGADVAIEDMTDTTAILALQGPHARAVLAAAMDDELPKFHRIVHAHIAGMHVGVSGTGYTGEKGVEIFAPADEVQAVWDALMAAGDGVGHPVRPIGLGARDTLRLEKGYCLAGNEFEGGRTPLEAGIDFVIDWDHDFLGKDALVAQRGTDHARLVGLTQPKGVPRHGYEVKRGSDMVGTVTSGTLSPTLGHGIALAYCTGVEEGDAVTVDVRGRGMDATVVRPPFV